MDGTDMDRLDIDIVRDQPSATPKLERRDTDGGMPTMVGHFSVFNRWYEIDSFFEGKFLERIAPGAFSKTISERRDQIKVLFQHGRDFQVGDKVLGITSELREDGVGAYYEVPLFDTAYNRDLIPGLEAGAYGASFTFRVMKDEWEDEPEPSDHNPQGIPQRTIREVRLYEYGPVTFPANPEATAALRSGTDRYLESLSRENPDLYAELVARAKDLRTPTRKGAAAGTPDRAGAAPSSDVEPQEHSALSRSRRLQVMRRKRLADRGI